MKLANNNRPYAAIGLIIIALLFCAGYVASWLKMKSLYNCGKMVVQKLAQKNIEPILNYRARGQKKFNVEPTKCLKNYHFEFVAITDFSNMVVYSSDFAAKLTYPFLKKEHQIKSNGRISINTGCLNSGSAVISFSSPITVDGAAGGMRIGDVWLVLANPIWNRYIVNKGFIYGLTAVVFMASWLFICKFIKFIYNYKPKLGRSKYAFFGPYQKICKLGAGTMAEVFLVEVEKGPFKREFALKTPLSNAPVDITSVLFEREVVLAAALRHPNIVQIFDFNNDPKAIVMEYVEGKTLFEIMRFVKGALSVSQSLFIVMEICKGLEYAHSKQIIHRDIKPSNIIISYQGEVKISDFGIAKRNDANSNATIAGSRTKGTYRYMSPEQILGDDVIGQQTDIYSLGIIFYELLTGQKLYDFKTSTAIFEIIKLKTEKKIEPLIAVASQIIPMELNDIIMRSLERSLEKRYQTAGCLKRDLRKFKNKIDLDHDASDLANFMRRSFLSNQ